MMGDHAIYHDGWIASTKVTRPPWELSGPINQDPVNNVTWELYDLSKDWTQYNDVSAANHKKLDELKALFLTEAKKYGDGEPFELRRLIWRTVALNLSKTMTCFFSGACTKESTKPGSEVASFQDICLGVMEVDATNPFTCCRFENHIKVATSSSRETIIITFLLLTRFSLLPDRNHHGAPRLRSKCAWFREL